MISSLNVKSNNRTSLACEPLEPRLMLSTVDVFAAGATGEETMEVRLFDTVLATFENVGGDFDNGVFEKYSFEIDFEGGEIGDIDDIFIAFTNDRFVPGEVDRNLRVDAIVLSELYGSTDNPIRYETEDAGVYSTGTWKPEDGVARGYRQSEILHSNGFFNFSSQPESNTRIIIEAKGSEGGEQFELQIDGEAVETFTVTQNSQTFIWTGPSDRRIDYDQVRIEFINDLYDPANGIDRNLIVQDVQVGRFGYRDSALRPSGSRTVFSTGTWRAEDGVAPGIRYSDTLHSNGYFQFGDFETPSAGYFSRAFPAQAQDQLNENDGSFTVSISRFGEFDGDVSIDYETRPGTADATDFVPVSGTVLFTEGVRSVDITIPLIDDGESEPVESFEFAVFNPTGGALLNTDGVLSLEIVDNDSSEGGVIFEEDFAGPGDGGWAFNPFGTDTADRGQWEIGFPQETQLNGQPFQLNSGFTGSRALVTGLAAGSGIGANDVDGGVTSALSPEIDIPADGDVFLNLTYNFAHTRSATFDDQLRVGILADGELVNILTRGGNEGANDLGQFEEILLPLSDFAGQTIQFLVEAEDQTNTVLEASIGSILIERV